MGNMFKKESLFEVSGKKFYNCTPHELKLDDGRVIPGDVSCAKMLKALPQEKTIAEINDIKIVTTVFKKMPEAQKIIDEANKNFILLVGSIIAAQVYRKPVVSPITTPETSRLPPNQRIVYSKKWNAYW